MKHTKAIELLTLILKGDDPKSYPDYPQAIRVAIDALGREMFLGIDEVEGPESSLAPGWIQYKCRGCRGIVSALKDSLCGHYQVCETCAKKKALGDSNMLPPGQVWLKEGSPGSGRYA